MSKSINHIKTDITVKNRGKPQIMSEKIQFWSLDQKKLKKRGEGSKYVGEHWSCDDWIKNDKKGRWSNYVGEHQSNEDRQEW